MDSVGFSTGRDFGLQLQRQQEAQVATTILPQAVTSLAATPQAPPTGDERAVGTTGELHIAYTGAHAAASFAPLSVLQQLTSADTNNVSNTQHVVTNPQHSATTLATAQAIDPTQQASTHGNNV